MQFKPVQAVHACCLLRVHADEELLGAFFFGRAFAVTLNKRITGALFEGLSAVGSAIASRDTLVRSFQVGQKWAHAE